MPGCGKSTVGRHLARQLGMRFVDTDTDIEARIGMPIRDYFAQLGEAAFRDVEQDVIEELTALHGVVLATGGGAVLRPSNRDALHSRTHVFYLRATPEELHRRLREIYRERDPLYRRTAHFVVEAARPSVPAMLSMVLMQLEMAGLVDPGHVPSPIVPPQG